jgi:hypothetical protein
MFEDFALVVELAAFAQTEEDFGAAFGEVHFKRDQGQALFGGAVGEFFHLAAVHEELARPLGDVVEAVGLDILGDVAAHEPDFVLLDARVSFLQRKATGAEAFHFAADEHDAAFQRFDDFVLVAGFAVEGDEPLVVVLAIGGGIFLTAFFGRFFGRGGARFLGGPAVRLLATRCVC